MSVQFPGNFLNIIISISLFACGIVHPQVKEYELDEVVVTASKTPLSVKNIARDIIVINEDEIKAAPVNSIQELLQYIPGVNLQQRGISGIQSDISIRGGNFEGTLILIDGIKITDPQTGHHNLNLPFSPDNIRRIEILKGQGSKVFGPNAFSGVINIITKKGNKNELSLKASGGENNYFEGNISASYAMDIWRNYVSVSKTKSDGYRHNTDFDNINFSYNSTIRTDAVGINLLFGYNDKKFGANGFYSVLFPNQWEHTTTKFLNISSEFGNKNFFISPKIYWRRNDDNYLLDYQRPEFYQNIHQTNVYGAEINSSIVTGIGITSIGGEYIYDKIKSTNLGNHLRDKKGIFAEQIFKIFQGLNIVGGAFLYNYSEIGWKFWPGLDAAYNINENIKIFSSIGKAFRTPTFTELYYSSPASKGNANLKSEEVLNYEAGFALTKENWSLNLNLFRKEGKNLIDWVRSIEGEQWIARNISEISTNGFEINVSLEPEEFFNNFPVYKINAGYTFLNSDKNNDLYESQYLLEYLRNQIILNVDNYWWFNVRQNWFFRYEDRLNFGDYFIADTRISKEIYGFEVFIKVTNLFNKSYKQISGVPLPGRWIISGIKYTIN